MHESAPNLMSTKINSAFQEALQEMGRPTSPEDLRRRGVQRLRSVTTSEVSLLIERAVNRTLMERTIGALAPEELAEILHAAENQFTRQLRQTLEPRLPDRPLAGAGRRAVDDLQALIERHVSEALKVQRRSFEIETENLERRVAKLVESLEKTEKVLARVAAAKGLEQGIGSLYRSVQGLASGEGSAEQKKELLARIFEANMALQEARASAAQLA